MCIKSYLCLQRRIFLFLFKKKAKFCLWYPKYPELIHIHYSYNRFPSLTWEGNMTYILYVIFRVHIFIKLSRIQEWWLGSPNFNYFIDEKIIPRKNYNVPKQPKSILFAKLPGNLRDVE